MAAPQFCVAPSPPVTVHFAGLPARGVDGIGPSNFCPLEAAVAISFKGFAIYFLKNLLVSAGIDPKLGSPRRKRFQYTLFLSHWTIFLPVRIDGVHVPHIYTPTCIHELYICAIRVIQVCHRAVKPRIEIFSSPFITRLPRTRMVLVTFICYLPFCLGVGLLY